jgi:hypothetical protein
MSRQIDGRLIAAGAALAAAVLLFGSTLAGAMGADDVVVPPARVSEPPSDSAAVASEEIGMQAVNEAVAVDPFSAERTPPAEPYRLPTDPEDAPPPPPPPAPPAVPAFRLVGTVQTPTGGVALIQVDNATPRMMNVGESVNGYVVEKVDATSAILAQADRRVTLGLQQPLSRPAAGRRGGPVLPGRGALQGPAAQKEAALQELQQMMRARENGITIELPQRVRRDTMMERNLRNDR